MTGRDRTGPLPHPATPWAPWGIIALGGRVGERAGAGKSKNALRGQRGIALVLVLWGLVLMAVIAGSVAAGSRTELTLARNLTENARARALADAGIQRAILGMKETDIDRHWRADGTQYVLRLDGGEVRISLADEGGKVDLNTAPEALLNLLFLAAGATPDQVPALVDAVIDFRDADNLRRLNGAEDRDYRAAGRPYGAKDALFEAIDELRQVMGVTPGLFARARTMATVFSGARGINPVTAPASLLAAMPDLDEGLVTQFLDDRTAAIAEDRRDLAVTLQPPAGVRFSTPNFHSRTATVPAEAVVAGGARFVREAVVRVQADRTRPFMILAWR